MTTEFFSTPTQMQLIEAVLFDLTGLALNVYELGGFALALILINVAFASPLLERRPSQASE